MRLVTVLVCIAAVLSCAWAEDVVCKKRTKISVQVGDGESFSFKTQAGREYKPKSRCIVKYKKSSSCPSMRFSCSKFSLKARNPSCTKGDKMLVVMDEKAKRFCQGNPPNVTTSGDMKIVFISNRASQSSGAECSVECVSGQDGTPGNTDFSVLHSSISSMILVPKLVVLILMCSTLYFEGAYSKKQPICKKLKLKGAVGDEATITCKKAGKRAKWVLCTGNYWEEIIPTQDNIIGVLPYVGKIYKVSFDLIVSTFGNNNVIHFTTGENDGYGARIPAVWTWTGDGAHYFHISSAVNGNNNYYINVPLNVQLKNYHIEISQSLYDNKYWYNVKINGAVVKAEENTDPQHIDDVIMYAGDPWYPAIDGIIRNLCVET